MKTLDQQLRYEHLELISDSQPTVSRSLRHHISSIAASIGRGLTHFFTKTREPQVWVQTDRRGQKVWYVREPHTNQVQRFDSEHEVMVWLDNRFYA
jgi:hypothetical protein